MEEGSGSNVVFLFCFLNYRIMFFFELEELKCVLLFVVPAKKNPVIDKTNNDKTCFPPSPNSSFLILVNHNMFVMVHPNDFKQLPNCPSMLLTCF